ncbi:hypothetical protein [Paraburkholderia sp. BL10I2N1]|uniref:hypothetical protein n=1 Tax=Paraburkholderia sp. BL10I2N1 TaxID=1938796 RepID=UPI001415281A|nr:hypothetical protein [Paraburkholderia sp. BL10I2N1]
MAELLSVLVRLTVAFGFAVALITAFVSGAEALVCMLGRRNALRRNLRRYRRS